MNKLFVAIMITFILSGCSQKKNQITDANVNEQEKTLLMQDSGKTFYFASENKLNEFTKKAVIISKEKEQNIIYLAIINNIIVDRNNTVLIDGSKYGKEFYAWKVEIGNSSSFNISCFWNHGKDVVTTDPLTIVYSKEEDLLKIWHIDPKEY